MIELAANGDVQFLDNRGRLVVQAPAPAQVPNLGWTSLLISNQHLGITSDTSVCRWDGTPVDYRLAVDALVHADRDANTPLASDESAGSPLASDEQGEQSAIIG